MRMRVYLKGGGNFAIPVTEFDAKWNRFNGIVLTDLEWKYSPDAKVRLSFLDLNQVAAIVREDDDLADGEADAA